MSKLGTVVKFEIMRTIKKRAFWFAALLLPALLVGAIVMSSLSVSSSDQLDVADLETGDKKIGILDDSKLLDNNEISQIEDWEVIGDENSGIEQVKSGQLDIFYHIPNDLANQKVKVFTNGAKISEDFTAGLKAVLFVAAGNGLSENQIAVLSGKIDSDSVNFVEGEEKSGLGGLILPIGVVVILYVVIVLFGSQNLTSMTEEKENRVTEMILTSVEPKTFIWGKIISLILLSFLQILIMLTPVIIAAAVMQDAQILGMSVAELLGQIDWSFMVVGACVLILALGIVLLTELLMVVGLMMPTAKAANSMFGVMMIMMFLPFFFMSSFISSQPDIMTHVLSLFPFSAPIALPLRMAFGSLPTWEFALSCIIMAVSMVILVRFAVNIFKYGALEYDKRVSLKTVMRRK